VVDELAILGRLSRTAMSMMAIRVGGLGISFGAGVLAARALVPFDRGELALLIAVPSLLSTAATFGLDSANLFYAAQGPGDHRRVWRYSILYSTSVGATIVAAAVAIAAAVPALRLGLSLAEFAVSAALTVPLIAATLLTAAEAGRGRALAAVAANAGCLVIYPAGIALLMLTQRAGAVELFAAFAVSQLATLAVLLGLSIRGRRQGATSVRPASYLGYAFKANPSALAMLLLVAIQVPVLQALAGAGEVAMYATAASLAGILLVLPTVLTQLLLPAMAAQAIGRRDLLRLLKWTTASTAMGAAGIALAAPLVVPRLFGPAYAPSVQVLWVMLPGVVFLSAARVVQIHVLAQRRFAIPTASALSGLGVLLVTLVALAPEFGAVGAAAAGTLAYLVVAGITFVTVLPQLLTVGPSAVAGPMIRETRS
jgi:O-antigen/teichoic acid export membrane protein